MSRLPQQPQTAANTQKRRSILNPNPVMRKLSRVDEYSETNSATYGGITLKVVYFMLLTIGGIVVERILSSRLVSSEVFHMNIRGFEFDLYKTEAFVILGVLIGGLIFQLLATFARSTTPVTGALYCITQGYFISFLVFRVLKGYEHLGALALALTLLIILVMSILYSTGVIRVTKKFKMVMLTLIITSVGISLLLLIGSFIPFTQPLVASLRSNIAISIGMSVVFIIIAALFLICDFDTIDHVVNDKLPKKYEWMAAFALSFTVIWLYLKVLDLIMTIAGNNKK